MKIAYQDELVTLYHGDFREAGELPVFDCAIVDPPYEETGLTWDRWPVGWPDWILRRLAPAGSLWCWGSLRMFLDQWGEFAGWQLSQDIVWEKHNGTSLHNDRFRKVHELAVLLYPKARAWGEIYKQPVIRYVQEDRGRRSFVRKSKPQHWGSLNDPSAVYEYDGSRVARSVITERSAHGSAIHPTQKPIGVTRDLVSYSCPRGGAVIDIFAGSATTLVAARELGRRAVGFEANGEYVERATQRLAQAVMLFEP